LTRCRVRGLFACTVASLVPAASVSAEHQVSPPVTLPAPAIEGQRATTEAVIQTTIDDGEVSLQLVTRTSVTNVSGDGSYTARSVIEAVEVMNAPASADVMSWGFDDLVGTSYDRLYEATGEPATSTTRSAAPQSLVLDSISMVSLGFPTTPVDVGDSWTVPGRISSDGMMFDVTYQCRLASVADGAYSVDVSYAEGFSAGLGGAVAEGTISGTGTLGGSLANPLVLWGSLNQTIDGVVTTGNSATAMRQDTFIILDSSEA
jgi:hypothetical protein